MTVAFSTRGLGAEPTAAQILHRAEQLDLRAAYFSEPPPGAREARAALRAGAVSVVGVEVAEGGDAPGFGRALEQAARAAGTLRAGAVVARGGACDAADREAAAERFVRALHGPLRAGVPLAVRNALGPADLLGFEEIGWVLDELPRLGFWFDPLGAFLRSAAEAGPVLRTWMDTYAGRVAGVFVHGGSAGGSHPVEGGPEWGEFAPALPRRAAWVLDLGEDLDVADVADAVRWLRAVRGH